MVIMTLKEIALKNNHFIGEMINFVVQKLMDASQ